MIDRITSRGLATAVIASTIAAFAGSASAQFVVDTADVKVGKAVGKTTEQTSKKTIAMTTGDGKSYKVTIENDAIIEAWANNDPVDVTLVRKDDEGIYFLDALGNVQETIRLQVTAPTGPGSFRFPDAPNAPKAMGFFSGGTGGGAAFTAQADFTPPPVMLGINLSSPGDALRSHLGLGDLPAILVDGVIDGLPAANAGLVQYDIIVSLDGSEGSSSAMLSKILAEKEAGDTLKMHVMRGGKKIKVIAELAAYDAKALGQEPAIIYDDDPRFPGLTTKKDGNQDIQVWIDRGKGQLEVIERDSVRQLEDMHRALRERVTSEEEIRSKVAEAMREAERRVIELRGGQLFIREADEAAKRAGKEIARLQGHLLKEMPEIEEELEARFAQIEDRFNAMEHQFEEQAERLGDRMERLMGLMERMADRIEHALDED